MNLFAYLFIHLINFHCTERKMSKKNVFKTTSTEERNTEVCNDMKVSKGELSL